MPRKLKNNRGGIIGFQAVFSKKQKDAYKLQFGQRPVEKAFYIKGKYPSVDLCRNAAVNYEIAIKSTLDPANLLPSNNTSGFLGLSYYRSGGYWQVDRVVAGKDYSKKFYDGAHGGPIAAKSAAIEWMKSQKLLSPT